MLREVLDVPIGLGFIVLKVVLLSMPSSIHDLGTDISETIWKDKTRR